VGCAFAAAGEAGVELAAGGGGGGAGGGGGWWSWGESGISGPAAAAVWAALDSWTPPCWSPSPPSVRSPSYRPRCGKSYRRLLAVARSVPTQSSASPSWPRAWDGRMGAFSGRKARARALLFVFFFSGPRPFWPSPSALVVVGSLAALYGRV
jgi:hypothetical protein